MIHFLFEFIQIQRSWLGKTEKVQRNGSLEHEAQVLLELCFPDYLQKSVLQDGE